MNETIWTTSTAPLGDPIISGSTTSHVFWDELAQIAAPATTFLEAKTRVNSTTLASKDIETVKEIVKDKLYKQLLQQLMTSGCVKIESVKNPANQSITFHARVELVKPKATSDENLKAA